MATLHGVILFIRAFLGDRAELAAENLALPCYFAQNDNALRRVTCFLNPVPGQKSVW
jgi:hypothetical protein